MTTNRPCFRRISHVAVVVKDLEKSLRFYQETLGCELDGPILNVDDRGADNLNAIEHGRGRHRAATLRCGYEEKSHLDLLCFEQLVPGAPVPSNHLGITHVGFWVDNMDAFYKDLSAKGVKFTCPPISYEMDVYGGATKVARFYDPDGTMIEVYGK